jgi:hypothetical protein
MNAHPLGPIGGGMKYLKLHDLNNPTRIVLIDYDGAFDILPAPGGTGSVLIHHDSDITILVHESAEEIATLVGEEV